MKFNFTLLVFFSFLLFTIEFYAQDISSTVHGGEYKFNENRTPCLTDEQRKEVFHEIRTNISQLKAQNRLAYDDVQNRATAHPLFSWPIKKKAGSIYNDVWGISNYVDQNSAYPNKVLDYNCGIKTYDTNAGYNHMGVDIYTWPFSWKMMDNDEAEIIAAAPGQIIAIGRNQADRSCEMNDNVWNAVYVQHADGSVAIYGHMKRNSPTSKKIGDTVERGEYLGIIGSSGNSTGPHLHFEAYSEIEWNGVGKDVLIDPYAGTCNTMNTDSWWENQKPYVDPNINAVLTHSAPPSFNNCPTQETTFEQNAFAINEAVYMAVYLRDQITATDLELTVLRPNGTVYQNWIYKMSGNYTSSYYYWTQGYPLPGTWTWRVKYQATTLEHKFTVGTLSVGDDDFQAASVYPNPFKDAVNIISKSPIKKASVVDILGKTILIKTSNIESVQEINLETLSKGLYFLTLEGTENQKKIIKLIKE